MKIYDELKTNQELSKWERIYWYLFDKIPNPIYRFYKSCICPKTWFRRIKFFYQRMTRGFDDTETYELDVTFFKWLLPRLEEYSHFNNMWLDDSKFNKELNKRIDQLKIILQYIDREIEFPDSIAVSEKLIKDKEKLSKEQLAVIRFQFYKENFMKWFCKNIHKLWW